MGGAKRVSESSRGCGLNLFSRQQFVPLGEFMRGVDPIQLSATCWFCVVPAADFP
jgi:hypothetical protein